VAIPFQTTPADYVADVDGDPISGATVSFWTDRAGGTQVVQKLALLGTTDPVDTVPADLRGQVPPLVDLTDTLLDGVWADGTADGSMSGFRTLLLPTDTARRLAGQDARISTLESAIAALQSGASSADVAALSAQVSALATQVADAQADLASFKDQVPSLEELVFAFPLSAESDGATATFLTRYVAVPMGWQILSVAITWKTFALTPDASNYWTVNARRLRAGSGVTLAQRSTQSGGGPLSNGPIVAGQPWTFDAAVWSDRSYQAGDCFYLQFQPSGAPAAMSTVATVTIRYQPT
jgi:hypothetical protein